jgi:hypothetical protein
VPAPKTYATPPWHNKSLIEENNSGARSRCASLRRLVKRPLLALPLVLLVLPGCGSSNAAPAVDKSDLPGSTVACLDAKGIPAHVTGADDDQVVLDAGPHIKFYLTAAEAEAAQFRGEDEGAEQIGSALLFVDPEVEPKTEAILKDTEGCLADL